jgi:hypothetical protein
MNEISSEILKSSSKSFTKSNFSSIQKKLPQLIYSHSPQNTPLFDPNTKDNCLKDLLSDFTLNSTSVDSLPTKKSISPTPPVLFTPPLSLSPSISPSDSTLFPSNQRSESPFSDICYGNNANCVGSDNNAINSLLLLDTDSYHQRKLMKIKMKEIDPCMLLCFLFLKKGFYYCILLT